MIGTVPVDISMSIRSRHLPESESVHRPIALGKPKPCDRGAKDMFSVPPPYKPNTLGQFQYKGYRRVFSVDRMSQS